LEASMDAHKLMSALGQKRTWTLLGRPEAKDRGSYRGNLTWQSEYWPRGGSARVISSDREVEPRPEQERGSLNRAELEVQMMRRYFIHCSSFGGGTISLRRRLISSFDNSFAGARPISPSPCPKCTRRGSNITITSSSHWAARNGASARVIRRRGAGF